MDYHTPKTTYLYRTPGVYHPPFVMADFQRVSTPTSAKDDDDYRGLIIFYSEWQLVAAIRNGEASEVGEIFVLVNNDRAVVCGVSHKGKQRAMRGALTGSGADEIGNAINRVASSLAELHGEALLWQILKGGTR